MHTPPPFVAVAQAAAQPGPGPGAGTNAVTGRPIEVAVIPFELINDHIIIKAIIDGTPATLILDTGSSVSALNAAWAAKVPLKSSPQQARVQVQGAGSSNAALKVAESVVVGPLVLHNINVVLTDLSEVSRMEGREINGTLGYDFLASHVVEIDFRKQVLRVQDPDAFQYRGSGAIVPVALDYRVPIAAVTLETQNGTSVSPRLVFDLGSSAFSFRLSAKFAADHPDLLASRSYPGPMGTGVGGTMMGNITRLKSAQIGAVTISEPIVAIAAENKGALATGVFDGSVGTPVFKHTRMIVDYPRRRLIFEDYSGPASDVAAASGLYLMSDGEAYEKIVVKTVLTDTPASEAGFLAGDQIVAIDDQLVSGAMISELRDMLRENGAVHNFRVMRDGKPVSIRMTLRSLI